LAAGPEQQFAPQGAVGNMIGQFGAPLGGALGGLLGTKRLGSSSAAWRRNSAPCCPSPRRRPQPMGMLPPELDPMGSASASWSGRRSRRCARRRQAVNAVNTVRQFLPLAAGPQAVGQEAADLDPQGLGSFLNMIRPRPPVWSTFPVQQPYGLPF
jgi:hypothetical protein